MQALNRRVLDEEMLMTVPDRISLGREGRQSYIHS